MTSNSAAVEVDFYHCARQPMLDVATRLAARALGAGNKVLVVGDHEQLEVLDQKLWAVEGFLAHGFAGGFHDSEQPLLLSQSLDPANGAGLLMLLGTGLPVDFKAFDRILTLFEDGSESHVRARSDWKAVSAREGVERSYWQQKPAGGWERKG